MQIIRTFYAVREGAHVSSTVHLPAFHIKFFEPPFEKRRVAREARGARGVPGGPLALAVRSASVGGILLARTRTRHVFRKNGCWVDRL